MRIQSSRYVAKVREISRASWPSDYDRRDPIHALSDVAQNAAQESTLYYSGPIFIRGPLKAYWAKGESLGPDTYVRQSTRDHQYL